LAAPPPQQESRANKSSRSTRESGEEEGALLLRLSSESMAALSLSLLVYHFATLPRGFLFDFPSFASLGVVVPVLRPAFRNEQGATWAKGEGG
jgi:hypothetical protein